MKQLWQRATARDARLRQSWETWQCWMRAAPAMEKLPWGLTRKRVVGLYQRQAWVLEAHMQRSETETGSLTGEACVAGGPAAFRCRTARRRSRCRAACSTWRSSRRTDPPPSSGREGSKLRPCPGTLDQALSACLSVMSDMDIGFLRVVGLRGTLPERKDGLAPVMCSPRPKQAMHPGTLHPQTLHC
jgi:hypothetical protein